MITHDSPAGKVADMLLESSWKDAAARLFLLEDVGVVYVAGPMTGIPEFNFPAFKEAAQALREVGFEVVSPAELDEEDGFMPSSTGDDQPKEEYAHFLARDIQVIADRGVQAIIVLPGWEKSAGVGVELAFARALGLPILRYSDLRPVEEMTHDEMMQEYGVPDKLFDSPYSKPRGSSPTAAYVSTGPEEVRVTNASTGGQKGSKLARFDLLPWEQLWQVAELYGAGALKYEERNWERGFDWSLAAASLIRHFVAFWQSGEWLDPETQQPHLASVVFHALALMYFHDHHPALDDRATKEEK